MENGAQHVIPTEGFWKPNQAYTGYA